MLASGFVDPWLFEDSPTYLQLFEEILSEIENLFDDWGQWIPISIEVICNVADIVGTVIDISMEPLQLEYDGVGEYIYTTTIKFDQEVSWRVAIASGVVRWFHTALL